MKDEDQNTEHGINLELMKNDERVKNLNMTEFYIETLPDVFIVYCEYHRNCLFYWSKTVNWRPQKSYLGLNGQLGLETIWKTPMWCSYRLEIPIDV